MPRCARTSGSPEREGRGGGLVGKEGLGRKQKLPRGFQTGQGPQAAASALAGHRNQEIGCRGWGGGAGRRDRDSPRPPPAHGKWSLCLVSGSGLLSCQDPGFPALSQKLPPLISKQWPQPGGQGWGQKAEARGGEGRQTPGQGQASDLHSLSVPWGYRWTGGGREGGEAAWRPAPVSVPAGPSSTQSPRSCQT